MARLTTNVSQSKWPRKIVRVAIPVAVPYLLLLTGVFFGQRRLLYFPAKVSSGLGLAMASRCGFEPWYNRSGQVIGWRQLSKATGSHSQILITHGNAGFALDRVDYARSLNQAADCDVYILEYPGYGARPGSPSQESFFHAADEAFGLLDKDGPVFLIGESLGTGVAAYLAGIHPQSVAGLLLIAPYHNLGDVAQDHMSVLPARWLLLDKFTSATYLCNYHGALAVVLGGRDTVVPDRFGRRLYQVYSGRKRLWEVPLATHNDLPNQPAQWWKELVAFWNGS
jgi:pimeloyl-ACP methyl ester carboxylesterase